MTRQKRTRSDRASLLALAAFSVLVDLPALYALDSSAHPRRYDAVVVRAHDTLWTLAAARGKPGANIQTTLDEIIATNHLRSATIVPGNHIRIPR